LEVKYEEQQEEPVEERLCALDIVEFKQAVTSIRQRSDCHLREDVVREDLLVGIHPVAISQKQ
jgi:hypothetical protein